MGGAKGVLTSLISSAKIQKMACTDETTKWGSELELTDPFRKV
jgi:hypothetical protein